MNNISISIKAEKLSHIYIYELYWLLAKHEIHINQYNWTTINKYKTITEMEIFFPLNLYL